MKYKIGDLLIDDDANKGVMCIKWSDGDICTIENDAAHPNPRHQINKSTEAIHNMISVEEAAQRCPDCCVGAFCHKHDKAFWDFWEEVKQQCIH